MEKQKSVFDTLSAVNVNEKTEKKDNLTYLSWAWAWSEFQKVCPTATYEIVKNPAGLPYFEDHSGAIVYTRVTVGNITHEMWLPVMDGKNKAMKSEPYTYPVRDWRTKQVVEKEVQAYTMFDINKTIMRCLTKNLAMFGLGIYIYAGEDLPEVQEEAVEQKNDQEVKPKQVKPKLDNSRLEGALTSIKEGRYTFEKLEETFDLTSAQVKKVEKFKTELSEAKKRLAEQQTENTTENGK